MNTFQLIIVILLAIYVFSSLYFSITGRVLAKRQKQLDNEYAAKSLQWEEQVKILAKRIGEVSSENNRLNGVVREWMNTAQNYKIENDKLNKSLEEWQKQSEEYKAKYFEVDKELKKFTTAAAN